jgi:hypothetical protein
MTRSGIFTFRALGQNLQQFLKFTPLTCTLANYSLKQSAGLNAPQTQEIVNRTQMRPKGKSTSTGGDKRIVMPFRSITGYYV